MTTAPKVTVIIPAYCAADHLHGNYHIAAQTEVRCRLILQVCEQHIGNGIRARNKRSEVAYYGSEYDVYGFSDARKRFRHIENHALGAF